MPYIVQRGTSYLSGSTTAGVTLPHPVAPGNTLVLIGWAWRTGINYAPASAQVTDTLTNTYTLRSSDGTTGNAAVGAWVAFNVLGGTNTVTLAPGFAANASIGIGVAVYELNPIAGNADPYDVQAARVVNSINPSPGSVTPTSMNAVCFTAATVTSGTMLSIVAPVGFSTSLRPFTGVQPGGIAYKELLGLGAMNPAWTVDAAQNYNVLQIVIKSSGTALPPGNLLRPAPFQPGIVR